MPNYEEAKVKLTNIQLSKLKSTAKDKTRSILIIAKTKNCHQKTKRRNSFPKNILTDIKLIKTQLSKIIQ